MDNYGSILSRMVSGDVNPVAEGANELDDVQADETLESMLNSRTLPLGTVIESINADAQAGILLALETFELQSCIGATQVITEGSDPSVVMEGAVKDFFGKIIARIKEFWGKVKAFFSKMIDRIKGRNNDKSIKDALDAANDPEFDKKAEKLEKDAKNGDETAKRILGIGDDQAPLYKIHVDNGTKAVDTIMDVLNKSANDICNLLEDMVVDADKTKQNKDYANQTFVNRDHSSDGDTQTAKIFDGYVDSKGVKHAGLSSITQGKCHNQQDLNDFIDEAFGVGKKATPVKEALKREDIFKILKDAHLTKQIDAAKRHSKNFEKVTNSVIDSAKNAEKRYIHAEVDGSKASKIAAEFSKNIGLAMAIMTCAMSVYSREIMILESGLSAYKNYAKRVGGKAVPAEESIEYTLGYGIYFEGKDADDSEPADDDDNNSKGDDGEKGGGDEPATEGMNPTTSDMVSQYVKSYTG